jgi:hypothetical protein
MTSPQEERRKLDERAVEALSMINTIIRNTELDYEQYGRPQDRLNRIRALRQYLATAYDDDDAEIMAMAVAMAMEVIIEERRQ